MLAYWSNQSYSLGITGGWINLFTATLTDAPYNWIGMEVSASSLVHLLLL